MSEQETQNIIKFDDSPRYDHAARGSQLEPGQECGRVMLEKISDHVLAGVLLVSKETVVKVCVLHHPVEEKRMKERDAIIYVTILIIVLVYLIRYTISCHRFIPAKRSFLCKKKL